MSKTFARSIWGCAVLLQLAAVYFMISGRETVLSEGRAFRFRTAPVDPYDAFRGRYVALALEARSVDWPGAEQKPARGQTLYVMLGENADGFATLQEARLRAPREGDYLRVKAGWHSEANRLNLQMPVDRYYLPENVARRAEEIYRKHNQTGQRDAYVVLKVRRGEAVAEDLVVGGRSIHAWIRDEEPVDDTAASP